MSPAEPQVSMFASAIGEDGPVVVEMDACDWLRTLPPESVDCVLTDPPYSSLEKHRKVGTTPRLKDWFPVVPNDYFPAFLDELYRVMRPNTHCYIMVDSETSYVLKPMVDRTKFKWWTPIAWDKVRMGMGYHYRSQYELVLFLEKGKRKLRDFKVRNVLPVMSLRGDEFYPTQKPIELLRVFIEQSTLQDELVIDPFCGSGSTGITALRLGCRFAGCDISPDALERSRNDLKREAAETWNQKA